MLLDKLKIILIKAFFCFKVNDGFQQAILFIRNSKKYSSKYKKNTFLGKENKEIVKYDLLLSGKNIPFHIRTYSGDFDIFYEVFLKEAYHIPVSLFSPVNTDIVIADLGANIGCTSVYFALHYPEAKIFALEAEEENYKILKKNISFSKNIVATHGAIDTKDGTVFLSSPDLSYNFKVSDTAEKNGSSVKAYSMFTYMNILGINHIDLLKIDIEGLEQALLRTNNEWLRKVNHIIIELHEPYTIDQLQQDLLPFGFKVVSPDSSGELKMIYARKEY